MNLESLHYLGIIERELSTISTEYCNSRFLSTLLLTLCLDLESRNFKDNNETITRITGKCIDLLEKAAAYSFSALDYRLLFQLTSVSVNFIIIIITMLNVLRKQ